MIALAIFKNVSRSEHGFSSNNAVSIQICYSTRADRNVKFHYLQTVKTYYVYILSCSDNTYYTGFTSNLPQRLEDHQHRKYLNSYTASRQPVALVFYCTFSEASMAIAAEKQIKKWSQAKKKALINGEYEKLPNLAKKKFNK